MAPQSTTESIQLGRLTNTSSRALEEHDSSIPPQSPPLDPYRHLSEDEATIIKRQIDAPEIKAGFLQLYRYATTKDVIIVLISCFMSIASGATMPLMIIVFGSLQGTFEDFFQGKADPDGFRSALGRTVLYFVYLAIGGFVTTYVSTVGFICM